MKPDTRAFYQQAVQRVVTHLVTHLDESADLGALAKLACLSPYHFHRVFRGMVGETPLELLRRLRLERAAHTLLNSDTPVTQPPLVRLPPRPCRRCWPTPLAR